MLYALINAAFAVSATVSPGDDINTVVSSLGPGDTITFSAGRYELENTIRVAEVMGSESEPIRLVAASGAEVVLTNIGGGTVFDLRDATDVVVSGLIFEGGELWETEGGGGVTLANITRVEFSGNEVRRVRGDALRIGGDSRSVIIRDNHLHMTSAGTGLYIGCGDGSCWMQDSTISRNLVHDLGTPDDRRSGIVVDNGGQANVISDNVVFRASSNGIRTESVQGGEANRIVGNAVWGTANAGIEVTGAAIVQNNIVFETEGPGIYSHDHENGDLADVRISYNTVALTGDVGIRLADWSDRTGMVLSSNVVANITGRAFRYDDDADVEGIANRITANVMSGLVEGYDTTLYPDWVIPGSGIADFADVDNWDFYLVQDAVPVAAGDPASDAWVPADDFNGSGRNGENPSAGALEWAGGGNPGWIIREDFKGEGGAVEDTEEPTGGCCKKNDEGDAMAGLLLPLMFLVPLRRRRQD